MRILPLYRGLMWLYTPFIDRRLRRRVERGKENPDRIPERWGRASRPRPDCARLIWVHAASVGESLAIVRLLEELAKADSGLVIVLTTTTRSSADILAKRLPERIIHQMFPLENAGSVARFLAHWRPQLAVWTESELWPLILHTIHRSAVPIVMVNGLISERSTTTYGRFPDSTRAILQPFRAALVQDAASRERFGRLGLADGNIQVAGSVKEHNDPPPCDEAELAAFRAAIGDRPVWLAASTHDGEFQMVEATHRSLLADHPDLLLIHAPRHPDQNEIDPARLVRDGWHVATRSAGEMPDRSTQYYLADSFGEMGLWVRLASITFVGGSLVPIMGHNPFEPVAAGSAVIHGWSVDNFAAAYARYGDVGGAWQVDTGDDLTEAVRWLLDNDRRAVQVAAAQSVRARAREGYEMTRAFLVDWIGRTDRSAGSAQDREPER